MIATLALFDLAQALDAFWRGSLGTSSAFFSGTLVRAIPLTIVGIGLSVAFRAGVFNIGGEGQLLLGAAAAAVVALHTAVLGPAAIIVTLAAAGIAGAAWAAIAAVLRARFGVLEVISTIMLNFVAANLVSYLVRGPLQEPSRIYPQTDVVPFGSRLPALWSGTRLHAGVGLAAIIAVGAWWFMSRTAAGFRIRAAGASPSAALAAGRIPVGRTTFAAFVASGALAGLAGGIEVSGVTYALYENLSPGYGFSAIAVALLARLNPAWVPLAALVFAALETGALGMQRDAGVPSVVALALEAVIILVLLGATGGLRTIGWKARSVRVGVSPA
jgi:general nucleoside transport system permease protein